MLTKIDLQTAHDLHQLTQTPMWKSYAALLTRELQTIHEKLECATELHALHELRGRARAIRELMKLSADSGETVRKLQKP